MELLATTIATCSTCHAPLTAKGECLACLLRGGLDEPASKNGSPESLTFGDFEIARREDGSFWELGCGAMGVTYRAVDKVLHRTVALKVVETPAVAGKSQAVRERFLREARAAAALKHPNVAGIFQFGASPEIDRCYYAMELVEGETLEALVRRDGPLKVELALEIAIQVTRALIGAAAQGLIHRDLKPGNIMLTHSDAVTAGDGSQSHRFWPRQDYECGGRNRSDPWRIRRNALFRQPRTIRQRARRCAVGYLFVRRDALVCAHRPGALSRQDDRGNP